MRQHWAQVVDETVQTVMVTDDSLTDEERADLLAEKHGGDWVKTDKNASYGEPKDGETPIFRGTYAGIGYGYDTTLDLFIPPMPEEPGNWSFNPSTYQWEIVA